MVKLAILASGNGTNAQRISEYFAGNKQVSVECIIYNKHDAYVAERAKKLGVTSHYFGRADFYSNGNIRCTSKYENGTIQGEVLSFYHDGRKKRIDVYETGKYQSGTCYGTSGGIIPHTDFKKDVAYPGGVQALYSIIIVNAQQLSLPNSETVTGLVSVRLSIDKNGKIVEKQIVKSLHPLYDAEILRICEHIGKFEPAERDGETVPGFYLLTVKY